MSTPKLSVVVPNYNHARYLHERLESIFSQTYQDFEVILLDDCSSDNSMAILAEYAQRPRVTHLVTSESNSGKPFAQWQKGLALARGDFVWIAESDDVAQPDFLARLMTVFDQQPQVVLAYSQSKAINEHGEGLGLIEWNVPLDSQRWASDYVNDGKAEIRDFLRFRNTIVNASAVVSRREAWNKIHIPTEMRFCGDWVVWQELLQHGALGYVSAPLNQFRTHGATTRSGNQFDEVRSSRFRELLKAAKHCHSFRPWNMFDAKKYFWLISKAPRSGEGIKLRSQLPLLWRIAFRASRIRPFSFSALALARFRNANAEADFEV